MPGDILYQEVEESKIEYPAPYDHAKRPRPMPSAGEVRGIVDLMVKAEQPVLITGTGVLWSEADAEMQAFVEAAGIPFYTTPQGRGAIPEDHAHSYPTARAAAFRDADLIVVVGTRMNYVIGHAAPPRWNAAAKIVRIDIDPSEIANSPRRLNIGVVADAKAAFQQLTNAIKGKVTPARYETWRERLRIRNVQKMAEAEQQLSTSQSPIHPLRLCKEIRDFMDRDCILCVDGQEILNYGRQPIPQFTARHRINSGAFGTMGVGMPFGVGAKVAKPDKQVIVLHGDGSFGMNAMEFDTAMRHKLPVLTVISQNGGWTGDPNKEKPGRDLGYPRLDKFGEAFGGHGEYVTKPDDIRPALERAKKAVAEGKSALVRRHRPQRARDHSGLHQLLDLTGMVDEAVHDKCGLRHAKIEKDELDARGSAPTATEINDRLFRQPKSLAPSYRSGRRPPGRRGIRGQACRASARGQGRLPDALTQTAARPAMELRAGERNSSLRPPCRAPFPRASHRP